jgi:hypothetical protein
LQREIGHADFLPKEFLTWIKIFDSRYYYIGDAEGHEYSDLQVGDEVTLASFLCSLLILSKMRLLFAL